MNTKPLPNGSEVLPAALPQRQRQQQERRGFTRLELVVTVATFALLAGLVLPTMGNTKSRSEQVACANNLRQIGRACQLWGDDHGDRNPMRVPASEGGLMPDSGSVANAPWMFFIYLQKELGTPQILVCPSDNKVRAKNWSFSADGGFGHIYYQNQALSYFVGLHAFPDEPFSIISGDHNLPVSPGPDSCSAGINDAWAINIQDSNVQWTNSIHITSGNIVFNSGTVQQLSSQGLRDAINVPTQSSCSRLHILAP